MNKTWSKFLAISVAGLIALIGIKESENGDVKQHNHSETATPTHPQPNGFFVVTSTSTTIR